MKKTLIILVGILVVIHVGLSLMDNGNYALERELWKVHQDFQDIAKDPKAAPPQHYEDVKAKYLALAEKNPKSSLLPQIYFQIGRLEILRTQFPAAREAFETVIRIFPDNPQVVSDALLNIGITHEGEKDFKQALGIYRKIWKDYPNSPLGLSMPLYIYGMHQRAGDQEAAAAALTKAISYYADEYTKAKEGTPLKYKALQSLATAQIARQDWKEAYRLLEKILFDYAAVIDPGAALRAARTMAMIGMSQLNNPARILETFEGFRTKYPDHPLNQYFQFIREKNAQFSTIEPKAETAVTNAE